MLVLAPSLGAPPLARSLGVQAGFDAFVPRLRPDDSPAGLLRRLRGLRLMVPPVMEG